MRSIRQWSRAALVALIFVAGLGAVGLAFPLLGRVPSRLARGAQDRIQVFWYGSLLWVLGVRVHASGEPSDEAMLWVSNHVSWLDIVVLGAHRPLIFVAKSEVGEWPIVGFLARGTDTLLVRRGDAASSRETAERMIWLLRRRRAVALFPEGTSSCGAGVLRFHARLFGPAAQVGAPVQAIAIAYRGHGAACVPFIGQDAFLPHLWRLLAEPRVDVSLSFCSPLMAGRDGRDRLAEQTRLQIVGALADASQIGVAGDRLRTQG